MSIIYCKECIHRPVVDAEGDVRAPETPDGLTDYTCPYICDDSFYNRNPTDDFFCGNGEKKKNYVLINIPMNIPKFCNDCPFFDEHSDYPTCGITKSSSGYTFNKIECRMTNCPLIAVVERNDKTYGKRVFVED